MNQNFMNHVGGGGGRGDRGSRFLKGNYKQLDPPWNKLDTPGICWNPSGTFSLK